MAKKNCQNCKEAIGYLEESYCSYYGQNICKACMIKLEKQFGDTETTHDNNEIEIPIAQERIEQEKEVQKQIHSESPALPPGTIRVFIAVAALASWIPARRAARIDPMEAPRYG